MLRLANRQIFLAKIGINLREYGDSSRVLRLNDQSLRENFAAFAKSRRRFGGVAFLARYHRFVPRFREIKAEIDVLKIFSRRIGQEFFRSRIVMVEHRDPNPDRCLTAGKFHVRKFCQNIAKWADVAGSGLDARSAPEVDDRNSFAGSEDIVIDVDRFLQPAFKHVSVGEKIVSIGVPRIERKRRGEIAFGFGKMIATAIDVTGENEKRRAVRQAGSRNGKFFERAIVVAEASEEIIGPRETGFR